MIPHQPRMVLTAFFYNPQGDHRTSWRHPGAPGREVFGLDYYRDLALAAERACLDAIFVADHVAVWDTYRSNVAHYANARLEPITLLAALSAVTRSIGLVPTASTSYSEPYNVARMIASLDHLSRGRAGWNVVTSAMSEEAMNYGLDGNIDHALRYARAAEFVELVKALWDSNEDAALLLDKETGLFADADRVHRLDHVGEHFRVRGPLNVPRPPQGHPVIFQAGSSTDGRSLAATHADVHFIIPKSIDESRRYRRDFRELVRSKGRAPDDVKVLAGVLPIVAASRSHAEEKRAELEALMPTRLAVDLLSSWSGLDLSGHQADGPLPPLPDEASYDGQRSNLERVRGYAREDLTIAQAARRLASAGTAPVIAGTATEVADEMEHWFASGATDGFVLMFPVLPEDWMNFAAQVVPELRRRGSVPASQGPGTLRDRLGLGRPPNRFA